MEQDFYIKMQAKQEEFQKSELHYQNTERKLRNSIMHSKEFNIPLQDYLQKINQREQETEDIYRGIMKQMDVLDEKTDAMILKFDKMEFLKNSLTNLSIPSWQPDVVNQQVYSSSQIFSPKIYDSTLEPLQSNFISTVGRNFQTTSSQTENLYCKECGFLIQNQSNKLQKKPFESTSSVLSKIQDEEQELDLINYQRSLHGLQKVPDNSDSVTSVNNKIPVTDVYTDIKNYASTSIASSIVANSVNENSTFLSEQFKEGQVSEKSQNQKFKQKLYSAEDVIESNKAIANNPNKENSKENIEECDDSFESNKNTETGNRSLKEEPKNEEVFYDVIETNPSVEIPKNVKTVIKSQIPEDKIYESKSETEINIDTYALKSDDESINNEFDFLETDTQNKSSNTDVKKSSKENKSVLGIVNKNVEKTPTLRKEHSKKNSFKQEEIKSTFNLDSHLNLENESSEISGNVSSVHSPNLSLASDSDSSYRKESPLKESAAYQALLGNTIIPKTREKIASESDSEDEVENALATVVQKTNVRPKSSVQSEKNKPATSQEVESKPAVKKSQQSSANKPQTKLAKSTRKVLCLDTSSGSDVELNLKPPAGKIDDDSDEFFYG